MWIGRSHSSSWARGCEGEDVPGRRSCAQVNGHHAGLPPGRRQHRPFALGSCKSPNGHPVPRTPQRIQVKITAMSQYKTGTCKEADGRNLQRGEWRILSPRGTLRGSTASHSAHLMPALWLSTLPQSGVQYTAGEQREKRLGSPHFKSAFLAPQAESSGGVLR